MADYGTLTYCRVIGRYNGIIGDTTGQFGDPGDTPDMYNVNMPATLKIHAAGTQPDEVPELRITDDTPPRTLLLTPIDGRVENGILRLPAAEVDGVTVVAKSDVMGLGDTPLLLTVQFGTATIGDRQFSFDPVTVELPTIAPEDYTAGVVQKVTITGGATGGQWAAVYGNAPTVFLDHDATGLEFQTALRALSMIGNNVTVTGPVVTPAGPEYTVTFTGALAASHPLILGKIDNLTGGSLPGVRVVDTYEHVVIDLTTADRILEPPSSPPADLTLRRLPASYTVDPGDGSITFRDQTGAAMGPPFVPGPGAGDMLTAVYDPTGKSADAFARANHHGQQTAATISDFQEAAQDAVAAMLAQGTGVTLTYDDAANTLTVAATGGAGTVDAEAIRDAIGVALIGAGVISVTVNDAADTITISSTATVNSTDAQLRDRGTHTGTQSADTLTDGATNRLFSTAEKNKLAGIATGATANASDAALRDRSTHTGQQPSSSISDFAEAAQDAVASMLTGTSGVSLSYDDAANTLTITGPGTAGDPEAIRDVIGLALLGSGLISVSVNDALDTITISTTATANSTDAALRDRSTHTGTQPSSSIANFNTDVDARVALGAVLKTLADAKGDLIVASAADAFGRLPVGSTGDVLTADSTQPLGVKWSAPAGGGGGVAPVVVLLGDGASSNLVITHGFGSRHVALTVYRNAAPWDTITPVRYERTDLNTITVKPDEVWPLNFAVGIVEKLAQSDATAPNPGTAAFVSSTSSTLTYSFTGATDNVAVTHIDAYDAATNTLLAANVTSPWTRTGLSASTSYGTYFRVFDAEGNHADTATVTHSTDAPPGDTTNPTAGVLSFSSKTSTSITYTFTAGSDNVAIAGVDAYDAVTNTLLASNVTSPYTRSGLTAATAYQTKLRYRDAAGNFADSNTDTTTTSAAVGPVTPAGSSAGARVTSGTSVTDSIATPAAASKLLGVAFVSMSHSNHNGTPDTYDTVELLDSAGGNWTFVKGYTGGQFTSSQFGTILMFKKTNLTPSVTHNLTCNVVKSGYTWTSIQIDTEVYDNAEDLGTAVTNRDTTGAMTISITTATDEYAVAGFVSSGVISGGGFSSGANVRYNAGGSVTGTGDYMGVLDKAGPGSPTVLNSTGSQAWGALGAPIQKAAA